MSALVSTTGAGDSAAGGDNPHEVTTVLVVDDSPLDRHLVGKLLESMEELRVVYACNGREGLAAIEREAPSVILTDLIMPDMEGRELVQQVRAQHPHISVILMTAFGSEEIAVHTLRAGAANYIPKKDLARDLPSTLRRVLTIAALTRGRRRIFQCLVRRESAFLMDNDPDLIMALLKLLQEEFEAMNLCDPTGQLQVGIALQEALTNALFHGNLEVSSELRQNDEREFDRLVEQRQREEPYRSRRIRVQVQLDREVARFVISDDGPGFDTRLLHKPVQPEDVTQIGGRGLLLIRTFMDQVNFNSSGNQISMIKYRTPFTATAS
jgi:DNA-binding NarL/FixJ family response regulator/anti-sigma regulatory factor (Ser/Thr protein kinase)